jgi:hypothetical protein
VAFGATFDTSTWAAGKSVSVELATGLDASKAHSIVVFKSTGKGRW